MYDHIISSLLPLSPVSSHSHIWCCNVPLKMKCFTCLCIENHINTSDNLTKKGWTGPNRCCLYRNSDESVNHLFVGFPFTRETINILCSKFHVSLVWNNPSFLENRFKRKRECLYLPFFLIWNLWISRNCYLFEDKPPAVFCKRDCHSHSPCI